MEFDRYLPVIEKYILAEDKKAFIETLPEGTPDRIFVDMILTEDRHQFLELARKISFSNTDQLWLSKVVNILDSNASTEQKKKAIASYKQMSPPYFDFERPTAYTAAEEASSLATGPDTLKEEDYSLETFLKDKPSPSFNIPQYLTNYGLLQLSQEQISKMNAQSLTEIVNRLDLAALGDSALHILKEFYNKNKALNASFNISEAICTRLTYKQLEQLPKQVHSVLNERGYFAQLYKKGLGIELRQLSETPNLQSSPEALAKKRKFIDGVRKWLEGFKTPLVSSFVDQLILEALNIDLLLQKPDLDLFTEYLKRPKDIYTPFRSDYSSKLQHRSDYHYDSYWHNVHSLDVRRWLGQPKLIEEYLRLYFAEHSEVKHAEQFYGYFDPAYVNNIFYEVQLAHGKTLDNLHSIFSKEQADKLRNAKELTILETNKRSFGVDEDVVLHLRVKNIRKIEIDVYEVSTEKHYLSNSGDIDDGVQLDFIEPLTRTVKEIDCSNPFKVNTIDISLAKELQKKPSIYIVDFKGEGISSRAVIKRGSIVPIKKLTLTGAEIKFYWENGKPIDELDVWFNDRKVHVKEKHIIPYGETNQNVRLVALKDGFAEPVTVNVPQEKYNLQVSSIYNEENFLVGSKAKVLLQARLFSNGHPITLKALKESKASVSLTNHLGIQSSFDQVIEWDYKNESVLEIPVQAYLSNISITVTAKVDRYSGKPLDLSSSQALHFRNSGDRNFVELYLFRDQDNYKIGLLGKNGEPKPYINIALTINSLLYNGGSRKTLMTNEKGYINLGKLLNVDTVSAQTVQTPDIGVVSNTWRFNQFRNQTHYPSQIILQSGQELSLPLYEGFALAKNAQIVQTDAASGLTIADAKEHLSVHGHRLVGKLAPGQYRLSFLPSGEVIDVQVLQAKAWEHDGELYDEKKKEVVTFSTNSHRLIGLGAPKVQQSEAGYAVELELNLPGDIQLDSVRAHVIASAFVYQNQPVQDVRKTIPDPIGLQTQRFTGKSCSYLSNKELSDEVCYVLARQNDTKFIGNNLDKPRILLKRTEKRETTFEQENLNKGADFKSANRPMASQMNMARMMRSSDCATRSAGLVLPQITTNNNFLKYPSLIIPNIHGKSLSFKVPAYYQQFTVVVTSQSFAIQKQFALKQAKLPTKDLRHQGTVDKDEKEGITMSRQVYKLQKGETLKVKRGSTWTTVGNSSVFGLCALTQGEATFSWALEWDSYSPEKKLKVYDESCCHELNTYLKYKDPAFFEKVVRPFLSAKLEKGVVDKCLLDDPSALHYSLPVQAAKLNPFEICLLIDLMMRNKAPDTAAALAKNLQLTEKCNIITGETYQRLFDSVLTSKLVAERQRDHAVSSMENNFGQFGGGGGGPSMDMLGGMQAERMCYAAPPMMAMACMAPPPPPPGAGMGFSARGFAMDQAYQQQAEQYLEQRKKFKPGFKPVEKTKQYVQTTYHGMTEPSESSYFIQRSLFWVDLAKHMLSQTHTAFLSENFIHLKSKSEYALAMAFIGSSEAPKFSLQSEDEAVAITAESPFLVFVKEAKPVAYEKKYGVLISQRFFDPSNQFDFEEDGTKLEKGVREFVKDKVYTFETVVTNTSVATLDLQILVDIPQGSIPIGSYQYTKIISEVINSYSVRNYQVSFYFPLSGTFSTYPANASKGGKIISKAERTEPVEVKDKLTVVQLESFTDVLRSGTQKDILNYVTEKNIFDPSVFQPDQILWMLKDKAFYEQLVGLLKGRRYIDANVWSFGLMHDDTIAAAEYIKLQNPHIQVDPQIFEYFPLSSNRAHRFMKEDKSTILNREFKETYRDFLVALTINGFAERSQKNSLALAYYLILQDRIPEAEKIYARVKNTNFDPNAKEQLLQNHYIACFLDMYTGYPNFKTARELSEKYKDYPVPTWRKLFKEVYDLLNAHDATEYVEEPAKSHDIRVSNRGNHLVISLPANSKVEVNFHAVNVELLFSQSPFMELNTISTVKSFKTEVVASGAEGGDFTVQRPTEYPDVYVHLVELASDRPAQKLESFLWNNQSVKAKVLEDEGVAYVYLDGKAKPGAYCKVYAKGNNGVRFFKDGYTDIQGKFKYITSDIEGIDTFAILFLTDKGGIVKNARKPNSLGTVG